MISVKLDQAKATILASLPATADRTRIVRGLSAAALQKWKKLAQERLRSTSRDYVNGLEHSIEGEKATISLNGKLPNMIERGWPGGDMRDWLLSSPKAKQGKRGPYLVVPFRHGSPETTGRNVGPTMPDSIYDVAKKLSPTLSRPGKAVSNQGGRTTVWGARLHPGLPMSAQARGILGRVEKPWHATSIYMDMVRKGKHIAGGKIQTTGYHTFRTISRAVRMGEDEQGFMRANWTHPGIHARNLAREVEKYIAKIASAVVAQATGGAK